jgi:elongation factor P--beta-lysine ligase
MRGVGVVVSDEGLGGVVPFGRGLADLGLDSVLLTGPVAEARLVGWSAVYTQVIVLADPYDAGTLASAARRAAAGRPIKALFSCFDGLVLAAAQAAASLDLPHPALEGLARARNKLATRLATLRQGIPTPLFTPITARGDCSGAAFEVGFPAVVKPLNGMASHLVRRVDNLASLEASYEEAETHLRSSFAGNYRRGLTGRPGEEGSELDARTTLLCEEFLAGVEHSAEVVVRDGAIHRIALFHKFLIDPRGFLECGFTRPSFGHEHRTEEIWQHVEVCLKALGVDHAAAHVEILDTAAGPRLVEVNAGRAGGQILVMAVREATGIDLIAEILALQLGRPRPRPTAPTSNGRLSTLTVFPPASGRLEALEGLDQVAALPGVVRVVPFCAPGDFLDTEDKELFAVNLLVSGGGEAELCDLLGEACRSICFHITPTAPQCAEDGTLSSPGPTGQVRRPPDCDGQRTFSPTTRVTDLLAGGAPEGARVRVAGRARLNPGGTWTLLDGEQALEMALPPHALSADDAGAWVGVEGRWVAAEPGLANVEVLFLRRARIGAAEAIRRGLQEGELVDDPVRLASLRARARLLRWVRSFCEERRYLEVQTPLLRAGAEAANVEQYSLAAIHGQRLYLRTDPEEYLKRFLTAGLEAVYEISTNIRGELPDRDRLHEFTSLECYRRFATFDDTLLLTNQLVRGALLALRGSLETTLHGRSVSFDAPPEVRTFSSLIEQHAGLDLEQYPTGEALASAIRGQGWWSDEGPTGTPPRGTWLEWLVDRRVLPALDRPTYVVDYPRELGLSACSRLDRPDLCLRGELFLPGGWELAHLYENLTEPGVLRQRLIARLRRRVSSGFPGVPLDAGLLGSAELGMPPMSGLAVGLDRLLLLILGHGEVGHGLLFAREGFTGGGT